METSLDISLEGSGWCILVYICAFSVVCQLNNLQTVIVTGLDRVNRTGALWTVCSCSTEGISVGGLTCLETVLITIDVLASLVPNLHSSSCRSWLMLHCFLV